MKRRQKTAPLGAVFSPLSTAPQPASARFNHFLGSSAPSAQRASTAEPLLTFSTSTLTHPLHLPPFLRVTYFGSTSSVPKMDSFPSTLHIMARGIYRTALPTGLRPRPRLPIHRRPLSSSVHSLFSCTHASSHEHTITATRACSSSSTLDRTRFPRGNISETGEISEDWLASAQP